MKFTKTISLKLESKTSELLRSVLEVCDGSAPVTEDAYPQVLEKDRILLLQ